MIELDLTNYNGIQHSVYLCCIQLKHYSSVFIFLIHQRSRIFSHKDSFPIPNYLTSSNFKDTREGMSVSEGQKNKYDSSAKTGHFCNC